MSRVLLKNDVTLCREDGSEITFHIKKNIGSGASCVVYQAICDDNTEHLLKEYYPRNLDLERDKTGDLLVPENKREMFNQGLNRFRSSNEKQKEVRLSDNLKNFTSNVQGYFYGNGTEYIDMTVFAGQTYNEVKNETLHELMIRMRTLSQVIGYYHNVGLLHLDIKPDNIFVRPVTETVEDVILFDFDSIAEKSDVMLATALSYTKDWAAPEQLLPYKRNAICEATDIFSIGEIIFTKIFGRHSTQAERRSFADYDIDYKTDIFRNVNPKVVPLIKELFRHTLCAVPQRRYQTAGELIALLDKIIELSNPKEPFLKSSLPNVSGFFTGRNAEIEEIHNRLQENNILFLSGIGGIGKSELAKHYSDKYKYEYDAIIFAPFIHDVKMMVSSDEHVPIYHFHQYPEEKPDEYFARKIRKLGELCDKRTLIIVDNLDTKEDENLDKLFKLGCKMLVTTRMDFSDVYPNAQIDLGVLADPFSVFNEYYKKPLSEDDRKCVDEIIEIVCGHTMTVELLAKQMMAGRVKPEKMLDKLKNGGVSDSGKEKVRTAKDGKLVIQSTSDHIQALFDLSELDEDEKYVLANLSLIPYTGIPTELFYNWCELEDYDCINRLTVEGWIRQDKELDYISLHPIVGDISFHLVKCNPEYCENMLKKSVLSCSDDAAFSIAGIQSSAEYATLCMLFSQKVIKSGLSSEQIVYFLNDIPTVFWRFGYTHEAIFCREQALNVSRTTFGEKHEQTAVSYRELGAIYLEQSLFEKAEQYLSTALDIQRNIYSDDNIDVANTLYCLGHLYLEQNRFQCAEKCYMDALKIYIDAYGDSHTKISNVYNDLGMLFWLQSDFEMAEKYYLDAISISKKLLGDICSDVASGYGNLGILYHDYGFLDNAEKFYLLAYDICISLYGEQHTLTANVMNSLGDLYRDQSNYEKAEAYLTKALRFYQASYGEYHDETANSYNNIGALYRDQKNYQIAERYYSKALLIWLQIHGKNHTYTAIAHGNLAATYRDWGRLDIAESHAYSALKIRRELYGEMHLDIALSHYGLGLLYEKKKDIISAKEHYQKAFDIRLQLLGINHPETVDTKAKIISVDTL